MKVAHIVIIGLLLVILYQLTMGRSFMGDLRISSGSAASKGPSSIFGLKNSLKCRSEGAHV